MADSTPYELDDAKRLGHLLWEVSSRVSLLGDAALSATPLTPASAGVLEVVAENPGTSIAEMSRRLPTSPQGISQLVSRLEQLGYLERRLGSRGHGVALYITKEGDAARLEGERRTVAFEEELAEAIGRRNYDQLVRVLDRVRPLVSLLATQQRG